MENIINFISEKLKINKDIQYKEYEYTPKNKKELKDIIHNLLLSEEFQNNKVLNLNSIEVSNITDFSALFENEHQAWDIKEIIANEWDVSNATHMSYMFRDCEELEKINVSAWTVISCRKFIGMFSLCRKLKTLDLSDWITSSAQNMKYMFNECHELESVGDISKWNIKQVLDFNYMFNECNKLKLDISSWKFNKKARISNMNIYAKGVKLPS